jgi:hypothetical protein
MRRKAVIQHRPTQGRVGVGELASEWHVHACINADCHLTYQDYGCEDVNANGECTACRGLARPFWETQRDPIACCPDNTDLLTTKAERLIQRLAGPGPWFRCRTCRRAHPWPVTDERNA